MKENNEVKKFKVGEAVGINLKGKDTFPALVERVTEEGKISGIVYDYRNENGETFRFAQYGSNVITAGIQYVLPSFKEEIKNGF